MGRQIKELRDLISRYLRDYRKIGRLLETEGFSKWYMSLSEEHQGVVAFLIVSRRYVTLYKMYRKDLPLTEMSYRQLRIEAQRRGIYNYSRLTKAELIHKISDNEEANEQ